MPKLDKWSVVAHPDDRTPFTPPESVRPCLHGIVTGHPHKEDGTSITTSMIQERLSDGRIRTENTVYELGDVEPEYEKQFPGAVDRVGVLK